MIFSKKVNITLGIIVVGIICICMASAFELNRRFPNAKVVSNDETDSIIWKGCRVRAIEKQIYSVDEYNALYPDDESHQYLSERDTSGMGIVLYRVEVMNENDYEVNFKLVFQAEAAAFPSAWYNGLSPLSGGGVLEPGETQIMEATALYAPSLVHFTQLENMENNRFQLIFSFYPERVVLEFD